MKTVKNWHYQSLITYLLPSTNEVVPVKKKMALSVTYYLPVSFHKGGPPLSPNMKTLAAHL